MTEDQAARRYHMGFIPAMIIFLGGSFGLAWLNENSSVAAPTLIGLAIVPILASLSMFWLHWRFLNEIDEFLRQIQTNALLFGAAVVMAVATAWGYCEAYLDAPSFPMFWLNPMFWVAYATAVSIQNARNKAD